MSVRVSFHGAVGGVTGSCHLVEAGGLRMLIDCGLFQGEGQWRARNHGDFGFDPASIDCLLLTHAHLDHSGRIPLLVKKGFNGRIICTPATLDIAKVVLLDSAHIQEEDFEHWKEINLKQGFQPKEPLYTTFEALDSFNYFDPSARYGRPIDLNGKVRVTYHDAGHILGAAFIHIEAKGEARLVFSGDLGNAHKPIIRDPSLLRDADIIAVESTYGDRTHKDISHSVEELRKVIHDTFARGGNVVIPAFAIERAQDLLYFLRQMKQEGGLPHCPVFLDSPMAINVTNIMRRHPDCFDSETLRLFNDHVDPFAFEGLEFTKTQEASKKINHITGGAIIIAGSGMCTGGRIRLHLKHHIWRRESSVVFLGYQAMGTLGREIVDGAEHVSFFGETYRVNASVHTIGGFSSHADRNQLIEWLSGNKGTERIFLIHGEGAAIDNFKFSLEEGHAAKEVTVPELNRQYEL